MPIFESAFQSKYGAGHPSLDGLVTRPNLHHPSSKCAVSPVADMVNCIQFPSNDQIPSTRNTEQAFSADQETSTDPETHQTPATNKAPDPAQAPTAGDSFRPDHPVDR
jgi:hypothetical protein